MYAPLGELWFNEKPGGPTASVAVRRALTEAVQLSQLGQVLSSGTGKTATGAIAPALSPCKGNTIGSSLPSYDLSARQGGPGGPEADPGAVLPDQPRHRRDRCRDAAAADLVAARASPSRCTASPTPRSARRSSRARPTGTSAIIPVGLTSPTQLTPFVSGATPPKGADFAYINNAAYTADVTKASSTVGQAGCPSWNAAETALFKNVDLVPFVNSAITSYAKGATFQLSQGDIQPSSIRMLG